MSERGRDEARRAGEESRRVETLPSYRIALPPRAPRLTPAPVLVAIHGYGQSPDEMLAYARRVAPDETVVLAPCGPYAWEAALAVEGEAEHAKTPSPTLRGWVVVEQREADEVRNAAWLDAVWTVANAEQALDPTRMVVLGYSQGVGVALHWLLESRRRAAGFVGLAGGLRTPLRARLDELAGLPTLWITGRHDRAYPVAYTDVLRPALEVAGLRVDAHVLDAGHRLLEPAAPLVHEFVAARLATAPPFGS